MNFKNFLNKLKKVIELVARKEIEREVKEKVKSKVQQKDEEIITEREKDDGGKTTKSLQKKKKVLEKRELEEEKLLDIKKELRKVTSKKKYREKDLNAFVEDSYKQFLQYANEYGYIVLDEKKMKNILYRMRLFKLITRDVFLDIIKKVTSDKKQKVVKEKEITDCSNYTSYFSNLFLDELRTLLSMNGANSILFAKENSYANTTKYPLNPNESSSDFRLYIYSNSSPFLKERGGMFYVKHFSTYSVVSVYDKEVVFTNRFDSSKYRVNAVDYLKSELMGREVQNSVQKRKFFAVAFSEFARKHPNSAIWGYKNVKHINRNLRFMLKPEYLNSIGSGGKSVYRSRDLIGDFFKFFVSKYSSDPRFRNCVRAEYIKDELKVLFFPRRMNVKIR